MLNSLLRIVLLTSLALAGCKPTPKEVPLTPGKDGAAATPRKVFEMHRANAHKSLDPPRQFDAASGEIIYNIYDSLFEYHYLKRPYELIPLLLKGMPSLSEDGLTYTFELRKGVTFHDNACFEGGKGRELVSDDVIYTVKRFADANVNNRSYQTLLEGYIVGLDALRKKSKEEGKAFDLSKHEVEGLKKLDKYRFTMTLVQPNPLFLMSFASACLAIVPKEGVDKYGKDFERNPVGTGAFYMAEYSRRGTMVLKKNERYEGVYPSEGAEGDKEKGLLKAAGKKLPLLDEIRLPLIEEAQPAMLKFLKGEIDWIGLDKNNFVKMAYKDEKGFHLNKEYAAKYQMYTEMTLSAEYYAFNMKDSLLGKNKALRQAIAYAMDVPGYIERMRNGRGVKLHSIVPYPIAGNAKELDTKFYDTNLEAARAKLVEAGFPEGKGLPPIVVDYRASTTNTRQDYEFHRAQLAKVGIKIEGGFQTFSAFLRKVAAGNFQVAASGWAADYPDPENFYQLFYGPNKVPGPNDSSYINPEFDKLYEQSRYMKNSPERFALLKKMEEILKEDAPAVYTWNPIVFGLFHPWVSNMKRNMLHDRPFKYLDVDPAVKAKGAQ